MSRDTGAVNVRPGPARLDMPDGLRRDVVRGGDFATTNAGRDELPNPTHAVIGQFREAVRFTALRGDIDGATAFRVTVGGVVSVRTDCEVIEPETRRVIATVHYDFAGDVVAGVFHNLAVNVTVLDAPVTVVPP